VTTEGSLTAAAEGYAQFHFLNGDPYSLSHWLDGGPGDRAWRAGYCCAVGEILVVASAPPEHMVDLWMNSPGHRAIITDAKYSQIGVGCYQAPYQGREPILCVADFGALVW
jgi:uncharacterized protein YkwD